MSILKRKKCLNFSSILITVTLPLRDGKGNIRCNAFTKFIKNKYNTVEKISNKKSWFRALGDIRLRCRMIWMEKNTFYPLTFKNMIYWQVRKEEIATGVKLMRKILLKPSRIEFILLTEKSNSFKTAPLRRWSFVYYSNPY